MDEFTGLRFLGFSHYESKAIEYLLRETLTAKQLSKKAHIPYGKVHSIMLSLKKKGIASETNSRPKMYFIANASKAFQKVMSAKYDENNTIIDGLKNAFTLSDKAKSSETPFFQIATTNEQNKELQLRVFTEAKKEVCQLLNVYHKPNSNRVYKTLWETEIKNAVDRGVIFREIYSVNSKLPKILLELSQKRPKEFCVRRIDSYMTRFDIIDRKKVLIKLNYTDPLLFGVAIFIENSAVAKNLHSIFEDIWKDALL